MVFVGRGRPRSLRPLLFLLFLQEFMLCVAYPHLVIQTCIFQKFSEAVIVLGRERLDLCAFGDLNLDILLDVVKIRMFKRRSYILGAVFAVFTIGNQIFRCPTAVCASGLDMIIFNFSPTCRPAPLTLPVCSRRNHFLGRLATYTLLSLSLNSCCSTSVPNSSSTVSAPAACSRT